MEIREWEAYKIKIKNNLVIIIIALCISVGIFYNQCENQKMPAPIFPLQREMLEQVLSESGLGWNVAEENTLREDHILYGGFKNENQVYKNFQETYDERVIIDKVPGYNLEFCERIRWENEIDGVNCFLGFGGQEKGGGLSKAQFVTIIFSQKPETGM